jgi:hypothetical protein
MGGIRRNLRCGKVLLEFMRRKVFTRCIPFFTLEEMFGGINPRSTEVGCEVISVSHHVMISDIKVVFDISPFIIGE